MAEIYGHRFTSTYGEDAGAGAGEMWAKGLVGITAEQMGTGLKACITRADPWPPTLPEFRALCLGIPSIRATREDLQRKGEERQPFTLMVARYLDNWAYSRAEQAAADRMLREAYEAAREAVMAGEPLPERLKAIESKPEPIKGAVDREKAQAYINAMRAFFHGSGEQTE